MTVGKLHRDEQVTSNFGLACVLFYLGYRLVRLETSDSSKFTFLCPRLDFEDLQKEYFEGTISLANAKAFVEAHREIGQRLKAVRFGLGYWIDPDFLYGTRN